MNTHEYQAKEILKNYGIPIPPFSVIKNAQDVPAIIKKMGLETAVLKIQVHAGGRGKAGGVKFAKTPKEIESIAKTLLGMKMVNNQTGLQGVIAHELLISPPIDIDKEYYLGVIIDREQARPLLIASPEGGMDIEEVALNHPEKILQLPIELDGSIKSFRLNRLVHFMGWKGDVAKVGMQIAKGIAKAFIDTDASLVEINPLVLSKEGKLLALDAKISIDDNALFRQKQIASYYDPTQQSPQEVAAKEWDLAYIALEGNIGCMVNGAGLAMATMDIIQYCGGKPANFLDVGGGASKEKVAIGFKIILRDPKVKAILVNIFGGIMDCAVLAEGIVAAMQELGIQVPLVVRMEGTNVAEGKRILEASKLPIITAKDLKEAALKVCAQLER